MADSGPIPLYMRVGNGSEHKVGHIDGLPAELPQVLRKVADECEKHSGQTTEEEREQPSAPRDREIKAPQRDRKGTTR